MLKNAWLAFRRAQTRVLLAILYYGVLTPYTALLRIFGAKWLETGFDARESYWTPRPPSDSAETARRLY